MTRSSPHLSGRRRSRRRLVALAVVVVLGAAVWQLPTGQTVASFVDDTFASSTFSAAKWNMQGSTNGTQWADNVNAPATLTLSSGKVAPNQNSYASFDLRMARPASAGATVTMSGGAVVAASRASVAVSDQTQRNAIADLFTLRAVTTTTGTTCTADAFAAGSTYVVGSPSSSASPRSTPTKTFALPAASTTADGMPVRLCFEFGVQNNSQANGTGITVEWTFTGVSTS